MAPLYVPRFGGSSLEPAWLRPADHEAGELLIVAVGGGDARSVGRLTRLRTDPVQTYRVRRRQPGFSWRSAWFGALSALGLVGGLAAGAEATQPDRPIRIALPLARPAAAPAPAMLVGPVMAPSFSPGRSNTGLRARGGLALPSVTSISSSALLPGTLPRTPPQLGSGGSGDFYRAESIQAAVQRAILSGIAQSWTLGGLTGVVIAGPLELRSGRACHRIALWAENRPESGDSMGFASCLNDRAEWKTPPGQEPDPSSNYSDTPQFP